MPRDARLQGVQNYGPLPLRPGSQSPKAHCAGWVISARTQRRNPRTHVSCICFSSQACSLEIPPSTQTRSRFRIRIDFSHGLSSALWKSVKSVHIPSDADWCRWTVVTALLFGMRVFINCIKNAIVSEVTSQHNTVIPFTVPSPPKKWLKLVHVEDFHYILV